MQDRSDWLPVTRQYTFPTSPQPNPCQLVSTMGVIVASSALDDATSFWISKQHLHVYSKILLSSTICFLWYFRPRFRCSKLSEGIQVAFTSVCDISQELRSFFTSVVHDLTRDNRKEDHASVCHGFSAPNPSTRSRPQAHSTSLIGSERNKKLTFSFLQPQQLSSKALQHPTMRFPISVTHCHSHQRIMEGLK